MFVSLCNQRDEAEQGQYEKESIAQAQRIMKPFVLRRLKKDVREFTLEHFDSLILLFVWCYNSAATFQRAL